MVVLLTCSCGYKPPSRIDRLYGEKHPPRASEMRGSFAIGGVVLGDEVKMFRSPELPPDGLSLQDQAMTWSPVLGGVILAAEEPLDALSHLGFIREVGNEHLPELLQRYAAGQYLSPDILTDFAKSPAGVRYLVMARIEADEIHLSADISSTGAQYWNPPPSGEQRDHGSEPQGRTLSPEAERTVKVTMDLFDLASGHSIWTVQVSRSTKKFVDVAAMGFDAGTADQIFAEDPFYRNTAGRDVEGPDFEGVLRSCFVSLVGQLAWEPVESEY